MDFGTPSYSNTAAGDLSAIFSGPNVIKDAAKSLSELERLDHASFMTIAEDMMALPLLPDSEYLHAMSQQVQTDTDNFDWVLTTVAEDGRPTFTCLQCLKTHDRKTRARDCRNSHLEIKPYKCLGRCGNGNCNQSYALEQLLTRHCAPKRKECDKCHKQITKQNAARHKESCSKRSQAQAQ